MIFALKLLAANLVSLAAVVGAVVLAHAGIAGWGWFLAAALLTVTTVHSKSDSDTNG